MSVEQAIAKIREAGQMLGLDGTSAGVTVGVSFEAAVVKDYLIDLKPSELSLVKTWATHRQHEFATGRVCARRALSALGIAAADLLPDAEGVPIWPAAAIGCISHSRGLAMAVAARREDCALLGLDLEKIDRLSQTAMRKVVHPLEEAFAGGDQVKASVLFSLKEAFYKAQFPCWRTPGNFHDLALAVDMEAGTARVLQMDPRFAPELAQLRFAFRLVGDYVVSLCYSAV